eukprot:GSA25T00012356001.1
MSGCFRSGRAWDDFDNCLATVFAETVAFFDSYERNARAVLSPDDAVRLGNARQKYLTSCAAKSVPPAPNLAQLATQYETRFQILEKQHSEFVKSFRKFQMRVETLRNEAERSRGASRPPVSGEELGSRCGELSKWIGELNPVLASLEESKLALWRIVEPESDGAQSAQALLSSVKGAAGSTNLDEAEN